MRYYAEETVKKIVKDAMDYSMTISQCVPMSIENYPSIEIKEPHGRCVDADELVEYYDALDADHGTYLEDAGETSTTISNAPTILEASK